MDSNDASKLLREMRKYQRSVATYENARQKMLQKEFRTRGLSDARMQRELKTVGMDVKSILKETASSAKELKNVHKKYLGLVRPPILPGNLILQIPPDPNVFDIQPPALEGFGGGSFTDADCGFNIPLGEMNILVSEQGDGLGWEATAGQPGFSTLVYVFTPPRAGNILIDVFVDFKGQFAISANDHWYSSTSADIELSVSSRLFQHYWEFGPSATIISEHRTDSSNSAWIDQLQKLSYSTSVSANDLIVFFVEVKLDTNAHSSYARVDVDFKTGAERHIRVPLIQVRYF